MNQFTHSALLFLNRRT